jgi:RHS repeat-associated protein
LIADRENGQWTNYVWFAGELVGMTRAGAVYYIDSDHLGRPELITNASKAIVWQSNNSPFGGMTTTTNTLGEFNIGFPGQYFDAESNYWYNVNRYYVAALGRYLQVDPLGLASGPNPYGYVLDSPSRYVDPQGLDTYLVNRDLAAFGDSARSRSNPITHTFIAITNANGSIGATYSWGNDANLRGWNRNQPLDTKTAAEALQSGLAEKVDDSSLDPFVEKAYEDSLGSFEHSNGIVYNNCKTEANALIELAKYMRSLGVPPSTFGP